MRPSSSRLQLLGWSVLAAFLAVGFQAHGQSCPAPPPLQAASGFNLFTPQQEMDLGDAMAEQFQQQYGVVKDEALNAHLQQIGERIVAQLPPSGMQIRFRLVDQAVLNAWTIPGGRIYVTRKMVAWAGSDDEIAAVLAHELGHAVTHQPAVDMSAQFRHVLGTKSVGDRDEIFNVWHRYQESPKRGIPFSFQKEEAEQYIADRVALYALARAGYSPETFADFWDRFAHVQGRTGGWFSDLFGTTKPEQRRLREVRHSLAGMPPECLKVHPSQASLDAFRLWQKAVVENAGLGGKDELPGLVWKRPLEPPLQSEFIEVRFSDDGRWLLAQDDSSIDVLSRDPLTPLFRIDAPDAQKAHFTPDSKSVVFLNRELRVEKWSIAAKERSEVHEVAILDLCQQTSLSPDGNTLACFNAYMGMELIDVAGAIRFFEKKEFYLPTFREYMAWLDEAADTGWMQPIFMGFSPDNRYFVAARRSSMLAIDLSTKKPMSLPSRLRDFLGSGFTFLGPDRLVGINWFDPRKSEELTFPEGNTLSKLVLGGRLSPAAHGEYVIVRPIEKYAVGVVNAKSGNVFLASQEPALDVYDNIYARGRVDGTVALFDVATHKELAATKLPPGNLASARAGALSRDLKWLAVSGRARGGVWDLTTGQRVFHVRGFHGGWFDDHDQLFADFPEAEVPTKSKRMLDVLDPVHKQALQGFEIPVASTTQYGDVLVSMHNEDDDKGTWALYNADLEVKDVASGKLLWSKHFPRRAPQLNVTPASDRLVVIWPPSSKTGEQELKQDPNAMRRTEHKGDDAVLEIFQLHTGKNIGVLPVQMGGVVRKLSAVVTAGDWVVISDGANRVIIYSISGNQPQRRLFGHWPLISADGNLLCLENEKGHIEIYELKSLKKVEELNFARAISLMRFTPEGKNLFVLTSDQNAYLLTLQGAQQEAKK